MAALLAELIAQVAHEADRRLCAITGEEQAQGWHEFPDRNRVIDRVKFVIANKGDGDDASHEAWMGQQLLAGWRWGETFDPRTKRDPWLIPFDELPEDRQRRDRLFRSVVLALTDQ